MQYKKYMQYDLTTQTAWEGSMTDQRWVLLRVIYSHSAEVAVRTSWDQSHVLESRADFSKAPAP